VTDTQTDRRTHRHTPNDGIGRACIASRGKNSAKSKNKIREEWKYVRKASNHICHEYSDIPDNI